MNIRGGFFRLTLVVSIIIGIIIPLSMMENYKYKIYEVKREIGSEVLTIKFNWFMKGAPTPEDYFQIFPKPKEETINEIKRKSDILKKTKPSNLVSPLDLLRHPDIPWDDAYTVLKVEDAAKWKNLLLIAVISFASVWVIYLFIRWVIVGFIVGGFKVKS